MSMYNEICSSQIRHQVRSAFKALFGHVRHESPPAKGGLHSCPGQQRPRDKNAKASEGVPVGCKPWTRGSPRSAAHPRATASPLQAVMPSSQGVAGAGSPRSTRFLTSGARTGLIALAFFAAAAWTVVPANGQAADGQSLDSQPVEVQRTYRALYGAQAEVIWTNLHNWEIGEADACAHVAYTAATTASDNRSLSGESEEIPPLFRLVWGDFDARRWVWEHDCEIIPPESEPSSSELAPTTEPQADSVDRRASTPRPTKPSAATPSPFQGFGNWRELCEAFFAYDPQVNPDGQYPGGNEYIDHPHELEQCQRAPAN